MLRSQPWKGFCTHSDIHPFGPLQGVSPKMKKWKTPFEQMTIYLVIQPPWPFYPLGPSWRSRFAIERVTWTHHPKKVNLNHQVPGDCDRRDPFEMRKKWSFQRLKRWPPTMLESPGTWWFKVTFLGWLSDLLERLSDLQLGDEKGTLNHLEYINLFSTWPICSCFHRQSNLKKDDCHPWNSKAIPQTLEKWFQTCRRVPRRGAIGSCSLGLFPVQFWVSA